MKILFVASVYRHLTTFHKPYIQYFQSKGYEIWAAGLGQEDKEILENMQVKCIDIPFSRNPLSMENIHSYRALKMLFSSEKFDLIHVHTPVAAFLTRAAFRNVDYGKIVYTAHGFHFYKGAPKVNWVTYYLLEKLAGKWTDHLITINEEDYVNAQKLLPAEKTSLVHGVGVDFSEEIFTVEQRELVKQQLGIKQDSVVVSCVAELNANKNQMYLLKNWQRIKNLNPKLELLLIGTGDKEQELKDYVQIEKLSSVHILGYRRDVPTLLQITDIVTLLSHREGLPKSIMEAMVAEIPCIVTNTRGLRDLVQSNENGFVVNHENDEMLVEAFTTLGQSDELRDKMGVRAKELVKPFLIENVLKEYAEIYEQLLK